MVRLISLFFSYMRNVRKPTLHETKDEYFDSANIAESYSGIVLPLTCSFAKMVYERVYKDLLLMSGVSKKVISRHSAIFENLLGFFYGRMYYNMNNWYAMAEFVPGYRRNKENFELMITSNVKEYVRADVEQSIFLKMFYPAIVFSKVIFFDGTCHRFTRVVTQRLEELRKLKFEKLGYAECITLLDDINKDLLHRWYVTVENDFFVMTYLGILKKLLGDDLQKFLIFKSKATEQVKALQELSAEMATVQVMWSAIESGNVGQFEKELEKHEALKVCIESYLKVFGGRFANELKLESVGIDEDAQKLFAVLKNYNTYQVQKLHPSHTPKLPFFKMLVVNFFLKRFKKHAGRREEFRLLRSNTFAMARRLFRRMGKILVEQNCIQTIDDVFYLHVNEILTPGALSNKEFLKIIQERKDVYASYKQVIPPAHFVIQNGATPSFPREKDKAVSQNIKARPASSGVVKGRVRVFKEFAMPENIDFDILVTSHTDPGWTSLIALSKGLIIEHGGVLSHASIVARELGIPAVIGARSATDVLKNGQEVEIDGSTGSIKVL